MTSRKIIPLILVLIAISLFFTFQTQGNSGNDDNPKLKYAKVLHNLGMLLEQGHLKPKKIDDNFSKLVLEKFTEELDRDKNVFLQSDIHSFKKFENKIDDEINGGELVSFFTINEVYVKRLNEVSLLYKEILSEPFDYTQDENVILDGDKLNFSKTLEERKDLWRKRLKYLTLSKYTDLQDERGKNKEKKDYVLKADSTLEREARDAVRKQIERFFTTKKNHETEDENFSTFANAITSLMDPHTTYFPPIDKRSFDESMRGSFFGIGAQLKEDNGIKIASLITGMPAWKSGEISVDDELLKVGEGAAEPVDVTGYSVIDAVKLIRGSKIGSEVRLTIKKVDGTIKVVSLKRDKINLEDTYAKSAIINREDYKVGYIYLPEFYVNIDDPNGVKCSEDVAKEVKKLKEEKVQGIIIDLRGNGGGSLPEVVKMVGLFIEDGPVCIVKGRGEKPFQWKDKDKSVLYSGPLTVLVDEFSASASEIFAAAIQDYKRGIVIGSTSYGKGTVQRNIPLNPESDNFIFGNKKIEDIGTVKLTLQKFYRINGGTTQLKGVTPDIILPDRFEYLKLREKDNTSALPWDEIPRVDYNPDFKPWISTISNDAIVSSYVSQLNQNEVFNKIKVNLDWLEKYNDKEYPLHINKYKEEQKQLKAISKELEELYKLSKEMNVKNVSADTIAINATKEKTEKNTQWLSRISKDIYIDESVKVLANMINQEATARRN